MDVGQCTAPGGQPREAEIPAAFTAVQSALEHLDGTCGDLLTRLQPVTRQEPTAATDKPPPQEVSTEMAKALWEFKSRIEQIAMRLRAQIQRLEI